MTRVDRWQHVDELFHQALERPAGEREAWLDSICAGDATLRAEVASLLESDRVGAGAVIGSSVKHAVIELGAEMRSKAEGRRVGPYRLIRELGHGGMGTVYLAARDDQEYESEVAIKLVRQGLDSDFILRRFRRERQILARLHHPNIARLFDGGAAEDGSPYLVMEYIDGSWITKYAAQHNLTVEERLHLFLPVCAAVEHAHRRFIVHRDLKPANILIDRSGAPKLLDFGVSKVLLAQQPDAAETHDVGMMTPDYASPEQITGDPVTVTSDVYSLGAVLYELLSHERPHHIDRCTPLALERAICLNETVAPSAAVKKHRALARRLAGDLDNIVLRAMHKQPERRYPSVQRLAADIRRHLEHRPVGARPDSRIYRARKFVRRNRVAVALTTLVAVSLVGGAAIGMRQARIAQERFQDVRTLATRFVFDVEEAVRELPGSLRVRQLIARTGLEYLGNLSRSSGNDWALKRELATAYLRIGELQGGVETSNLGDPAGALASFDQARVLLDAVLKHSPADRAAAQDRMTVSHRMSDLYRQTGRLPQALASTEEGLQRAEGLLAAQPGDPEIVQYAAVFHLDLARLRQQSGALRPAAQEITSGLRLLRQLSAARPNERETLDNIAASQARLGAIQSELGQRQEALDSYRAGVSVLEQVVQRYPQVTGVRHSLMLGYSHVGDVLGNPAYDNVGDTAGALVEYGRMVEIAKFLHDADSSDLRATSDYGIALLRLGIVSPMPSKRSTLEQALGLLELVASRNPKDKPNATHEAWAAIELGDLHRADGDRASAARYYALGLAAAENVQELDPDDSTSKRWLMTAARALAIEQIHAGDVAGALATVDKAVQLGSRLQSTAPPDSVTIRSLVARSWQAAASVHAALAERERGEPRQRHRDAARDWYQRSMAEWRTLEPLEGFTSLQRREMDSTAAELAALDADGSAR